MPKQTGVNYGADLLLRSVGDNPSQRQGTLTGFNYDTVPRTRERALVGAQDVRSYLEWLGQGGGLQNLNALGQGLFGPQGRQTVSDIAHNVQGPVQPLGLGMGGPNEMMGQAMDFLNPMGKVGGILGQTVFHGSPHKFDKFDISKIGTGEGAQVYGHGLYFADNPDVAKSYMPQTGAGLLEIGGKQYDPKNYLISLEIGKGGSTDEIVKRLRKYADEGRGNPFSEAADADFIADNLVSGKGKATPTRGHLYKADIPDADIPRMLDWDKPLSEQPELVRKVFPQREKGLDDYLQEIGNSSTAKPEAVGLARRMATGPEAERLGSIKADNNWLKLDKLAPGIDHNKIHDYADFFTGRGELSSQTGQDLWYLMNQGDPAAASNRMLGLGIPGIKYYDQGSRGLGQGTRNYVTFGDKGLKILERQ